VNKIASSLDKFFFNSLHDEACDLQKKQKKYPSLVFIAIGILSMFWLLLRSVQKPNRLRYPCQQAALINTVMFLGWVQTLLLGFLFSHGLRRRGKLFLRFCFLATLLSIVGNFGYNYWRVQLDRKLAQTAIGQSGSKVTWVQDSRAAGSWGSDFSARVDSVVAQEMMDLAIKQYANSDSVSQSWQIIFENFNGSGYQNDQKIAIKLNFNNVWQQNQHNPNYQVVNALLQQLVNEVGISQSNIILYDISRPFEYFATQQQFRDGITARFPEVLLNPDKSVCGDPIWQGEVYLACVLRDTDYLVNMPLLRVHGGASATLSLKNHFGSIDNPSALHLGRFQKYDGVYSVEYLNAQPWIRDKHLLTIADAIWGLKSGNEEGDPSSSDGMNPPPNSIFISEDPVAVDSVMIDFIATHNNNSFPSGEPRRFYISAANLGLGTYETAYPDFDYELISLNRCIDDSCDSSLPLQTTPPSLSGDANGDGKVDGIDYVVWLSHYNQQVSGVQNGDFNSDNKVDGIDYVIWLQNYD